MQVRLPFAVLGQVVGDALRQQDVARVGAIHYALGEIDSRSGDIAPAIHVSHFFDRPAVNPHAKANLGMLLKLPADLPCATNRRVRSRKKGERHPVTCGQAHQFAGCFRGLKLARTAADDLVEALE